MKKLMTWMLTFAMVLTFVGCASDKNEADVKSEGVMTYAEYEAADLDT